MERPDVQVRDGRMPAMRDVVRTRTTGWMTMQDLRAA
jgi:hypothetical protein